MSMPRPLRTTGKFDLNEHVKKVLKSRGWGAAAAPSRLGPLTVQSHCSGADAPSYAL